MMQDWRVSDGTTEIIVEADTWLDALAIGLGAFGLEFGALGRLDCAEQTDGGVIAKDAVTGAALRVTPFAADPPAFIMPASSFTAGDPEPEPSTANDVAADAGDAEFHALTDDMVVDLFLRLGEISSCVGVAEASAVALRIVLDLVPAGASAVLIRTRAGDGLRFRAASGPAATQLVDTVIPLEKGIAGYVCQLGVGISIADVRRDRRYDSRIERSTGYATRAMLAVPVRADTGAVYGCLELLNPPRPFTGGDFEVAARVAASLGSFLNSVYASR